MSGLQLGKAIKSILSGIDKVYPLVVEKGTTYPFVVYRRTGLSPSSTKDRYSYREMGTVEVMVVTNSYDESIELAEKVKGKMEHTRGKYNGLSIGDIILINADEDYIEDAFVQKLTF
ncbi:MAG: hypothetical protein NC131_14650 [Roseburia sp.]|nr:hypothetical protein [Roseburia sp.]